MEDNIPQSLCTYTSCNKFPRLTCTRCRSAKYCSVECQTAHYPFHRQACLATEKYVKQANAKGEIKRQINRKVLISEESYIKMVQDIDRGDRTYLVSRTDEKTEAIKRIDGKYYEKDSGSLIINMKDYEKIKNSSHNYLTNWGRLMTKYGQMEHSLGKYCLFRDDNDKKLILLDREKDEIIRELESKQLSPNIKCAISIVDDFVNIIGYEYS